MRFKLTIFCFLIISCVCSCSSNEYVFTDSPDLSYEDEIYLNRFKENNKLTIESSCFAREYETALGPGYLSNGLYLQTLPGYLYTATHNKYYGKILIDIEFKQNIVNNEDLGEQFKGNYNGSDTVLRGYFYIGIKDSVNNALFVKKGGMNLRFPPGDFIFSNPDLHPDSTTYVCKIYSRYKPITQYIIDSTLLFNNRNSKISYWGITLSKYELIAGTINSNAYKYPENYISDSVFIKVKIPKDSGIKVILYADGGYRTPSKTIYSDKDIEYTFNKLNIDNSEPLGVNGKAVLIAYNLYKQKDYAAFQNDISNNSLGVINLKLRKTKFLDFYEQVREVTYNYRL